MRRPDISEDTSWTSRLEWTEAKVDSIDLDRLQLQLMIRMMASGKKFVPMQLGHWDDRVTITAIDHSIAQRPKYWKSVMAQVSQPIEGAPTGAFRLVRGTEEDWRYFPWQITQFQTGRAYLILGISESSMRRKNRPSG
jgi:hypothetical protein